ncbi:unnamed protein product, partial [Coregonus sp. 'balchen']
MLVGIHDLEQAARERAGEAAAGAADQRPPPSQGQKSLYCTAIEAIQGEAHGKGALDTEDNMGGIPACNSKGKRMLLYIGIIDILQSYRIQCQCTDQVSTQTAFRNSCAIQSSRRFHPSSSRSLGVPHSQSTETEGVSIVQSGRPDILPKTPTHDVVTSNSGETTLFNSLLGSLALSTTAPSIRSVGEEVHEAASTEQDASTPKSFEAVTSVSSVDERIGGDDVISLSDIVPQTSSCY